METQIHGRGIKSHVHGMHGEAGVTGSVGKQQTKPVAGVAHVIYQRKKWIVVDVIWMLTMWKKIG